MGDAVPRFMISNKSVRRMWKRRMAAMPAIPYTIRIRRRRSLMLPYLLGGIAFAVVGSIASVLFVSPRTRYRALDVARNTYGRLESQIMHMRGGRMGGESLSNGIVDQGVGGYSTGL
jgi:hypothetical protein